MKKLIIVLFLVSMLFVVACAKPPIIQNPNTFCPNNGYIHKDDVNRVLNVTNKLVDIVNVCYQNENMTPLSKFNYVE